MSLVSEGMFTLEVNISVLRKHMCVGTRKVVLLIM